MNITPDVCNLSLHSWEFVAYAYMQSDNDFSVSYVYMQSVHYFCSFDLKYILSLSSPNTSSASQCSLSPSVILMLFLRITLSLATHYSSELQEHGCSELRLLQLRYR